MHFKKKIKQTLLSVLTATLFTSLAYAHSGHEVAYEQFHNILHNEHLTLLVVIVAAIIIKKVTE